MAHLEILAMSTVPEAVRALDNFHELNGLIADYEELSTYRIDRLYRFLKDYRAALPNREEEGYSPDQFRRLDSVLIPLVYIMNSDVIGPVTFPDFVPDAYDVMLTDVRKQDLEGGVSKVLCQKYLSEPSDVSPSWPLRGTLYGMNHRIVVSAVVCKTCRNTKIFRNVHFIFDTGSRYTYLTKEVYDAFKAEEWDGDNIWSINGVRMSSVHPSHAHFKDVNLLGMDFLDRGGVICQLSFDAIDDYGSKVLFSKTIDEKR